MKTFHSNEFNAVWEIETIPEPDYKEMAMEMISKAEPLEDESLDFFESDFKMFQLAGNEIKAGRNVKHWIPIFANFIQTYPTKTFDVVRAVELLQAAKSKHILKQLDMNDELDIKVYQQIISMRNNILNKYNMFLS